jgi:hypothetical protein
MTLDDLLRQPLAPVRDDGFSARTLLALARADERRRLMLWGAGVSALLPLLAFVPATTELALARITPAASSPVFAGIAGAAVLLSALRPAPISRF